MAEVLHHDNHGHDEHHHHDDTDITVFGFWTYLMSDLILFGTLFIAFAVLSSHIPPGTPSPKELFGESLGFVLVETFALLISSVTFGFAVLASYKKNGLTLPNMRRLACLSLFWHFLDIVWICVFSVVYLMGVL